MAALNGESFLSNMMEGCNFSEFSDTFVAYLESLRTRGPSYRFDFRKFASCSDDDIRMCLVHLVRNALQYFEHVQFFRNIYKHIHQNVARTANAKVMLDTLDTVANSMSFEERSSVGEIVMFGAFLVEIFKVQALPVAVLESWAKKLKPAVESGNLAAEIAFLAFVNRGASESKLTITHFWRRWMTIFRKIAGVEELRESERRESIDEESTDSWNVTRTVDAFDIDVEYEETLAQVTLNSIVCKNFQASLNGPIKFDNNKFEHMTAEEIAVCARMIVDKAISQPKSIKELTLIMQHYQEMLMSMRSFRTSVIKDCKKDILGLDQMAPYQYINYAKFFGELYMLEKDLLSTNDMIDWIETLLKLDNEHATDALVTTLELCGRKLRIDDAVNFDQYLHLMKKLATSNAHKAIIRELEAQILEDDNNGTVFELIKWSNQQQPETTKTRVAEIRSYVRVLTHNKQPRSQFNYIALLERDYGSRKTDARFLAKTLLNTNTNPIENAKFLKALFMLSFDFGDLLKRAKYALKLRLHETKISILEGVNEKNLKALKNIGLFVSNLSNMLVIDRDVPNEYMNTMTKELKSLGNTEIASVFVDVLDVALLSLRIHGGSRYQSALAILDTLRAQHPSLHERIDRVKEKHRPIEIPKSFVDLIYKVKRSIINKHLVTEEVELSTDSSELARIFFFNAISNRLMARNSAKALSEIMKTWEIKKFIITCCQQHFEKIPKGELDEEDALGTMVFLGELLKEKQIPEKVAHSIVSHLRKHAEESELARDALGVFFNVAKSELAGLGLKNNVQHFEMVIKEAPEKETQAPPVLRFTDEYKKVEIPKHFADFLDRVEAGIVQRNASVEQFDSPGKVADLAKIFFLRAIENHQKAGNFVKALKENFGNWRSSFKGETISINQMYFDKVAQGTADVKDVMGIMAFTGEMMREKIYYDKLSQKIMNTLTTAKKQNAKFASYALQVLQVTQKGNGSQKLFEIEKQLMEKFETSPPPSPAHAQSGNIFDCATNMRVKTKFLQIIANQPAEKQRTPSNDPYYEFANALHQLTPTACITNIAVNLKSQLKDDEASFEKYVFMVKDYVSRNPQNAVLVWNLLAQIHLFKGKSCESIKILNIVRERIGTDITNCNIAFANPEFLRNFDTFISDAQRTSLAATLISRANEGKKETKIAIILNLLEKKPHMRSTANERKITLLKPLEGLLKQNYSSEIEARLQTTINSIANLESLRCLCVAPELHPEEEKTVEIEVMHVAMKKRMSPPTAPSISDSEKLLAALPKPAPSISESNKPRQVAIKAAPSMSESKNPQDAASLPSAPSMSESAKSQPSYSSPQATKNASPAPSGPQPLTKKYQLLAEESAEYHKKFVEEKNLTGVDSTAVNLKNMLAALSDKNAVGFGVAFANEEQTSERIISKYAFIVKECLYENPHLGGALKKFIAKLSSRERLLQKTEDFVELDAFVACKEGKALRPPFIEGVRTMFSKNFIFLLWRNMLEQVGQGSESALMNLVNFMVGNEALMNTTGKAKFIDEFLVVLRAQAMKQQSDAMKLVIKTLEGLKTKKPVASSEDEEEKEQEKEEEKEENPTSEETTSDETEKQPQPVQRIKNYSTVGNKQLPKKKPPPRVMTKRQPRILGPNPYDANKNFKHDDSDALFAGLNVLELGQSMYSERKGITYSLNLGNEKLSTKMTKQLAESFNTERRTRGILEANQLDREYKSAEKLPGQSKLQMSRPFASFDEFESILQKLTIQNVNGMAAKIRPSLLNGDEDLNKYASIVVDFGYKKPAMAGIIITFIDQLTSPKFSTKGLRSKIQHSLRYDLVGIVEKKNASLQSKVDNFCSFFIGMRGIMKDAWIFLQWRYLVDFVAEKDGTALRMLLALMDGNESIVLKTPTRRPFLGQCTSAFQKNLNVDHPADVKARLEKVLKVLKHPQKCNSRSNSLTIETAKKCEEQIDEPEERNVTQEFAEATNDFSARSLDNLESSIKKIPPLSDVEVAKIAREFLEESLKSDEFLLRAALAKIIDDNVKTLDSRVTFRKALIDAFYESFDLNYCKYNEKRRNENAAEVKISDFIKIPILHAHNRKMSRFFGHLFNNALMSLTDVVAFIDKMWIVGQLQKFELTAIFSVLDVSNVHMLVAIKREKSEDQPSTSSGEGRGKNESYEKLMMICESLEKINRPEATDFFEMPIYLYARETLKILELFKAEMETKTDNRPHVVASPQKLKPDPHTNLPPLEKFKRVLSDLNEENFHTSVESLLEIKNVDASDNFAGAFMKKCNEESVKMAMKLMKHVRARNGEAENAFLDQFTAQIKEQCKKAMLSAIEKSNCVEIFKTIHLICGLYQASILELAFVTFCVGTFFVHGSKFAVAYDCIFSLLESAGADMKVKQPNLLVKYMQFFKNYFSKYQDHGVLGSISRDLLEMDQNNWVLKRRVTIDVLDAFLGGNVSVSVLKLHVSENDIQPDAFIQAVWRNLMTNPQNAVDLADSVFDAAKLFEGEDFPSELSVFMEKRRQAFLQIPKDTFTAKMHEKLKCVIIFVLELYKMDLMCDDLDMWIHPSLIEKFTDPNDQAELSKKVAAVRVGSDDKRSRMFVKNLDNAVGDNQALQVSGIKDDLSRLERMMMRDE